MRGGEARGELSVDRLRGACVSEFPVSRTRSVWVITLLALVVAIAFAPAARADPPPFDGTAWIANSVITPQSPSDMVSVAFVAVAPRTTYDRRANDWVTKNSYVFRGTFRASKSIDFIVDPEFPSQEAAGMQASRYAQVVGQLPRGCRTQIDAVWLHKGDENFGGGNRALLIHTDYADQNWAYVEELLVHECAHTSLDPAWSGSVKASSWANAVARDPGFISKYAADFPKSEDVAESFLPYVMWKLGGASGVVPEQLATMERTIPHRFEAFESTAIDLRPLLDWPLIQSTQSPGAACVRGDIGAKVKTATYGWLKCAKRSDGRLLWVKIRSGR